MKKSELLKLIETLGDEDNVIDTLKDQQEIKDLAKSFNMNLEDFKNLLANNETIKGYQQSLIDSAVSKGVNGYEKNTLPLKIQEALKAKENEGKTPQDIAIAELNAKLQEMEQEKIKAENSNKYTKILSEKGVDSRMIDFIYSDDEKEFNSKLDILTEIINDQSNTKVDEKLTHSIYTPPSSGGTGNSLQSQIANAINGKI